MNKLSEYTYFYLSINITPYIFFLFLKSSKAFSVPLNGSLRSSKQILLDIVVFLLLSLNMFLFELSREVCSL